MAKEVLTQADAAFAAPGANGGEGEVRSYILFGEPPQLFIGERHDEEHATILEHSGRSRDHIRAIGKIQHIPNFNFITFNNFGSVSLGISEGGNPSLCVGHVESLPKADRPLMFAAV